MWYVCVLWPQFVLWVGSRMKGSEEITVTEGFFKGLPSWKVPVCNTCNFEVMINVLVLFQSWARVMVKIRIREMQGSVVWIGACFL